MQQTPSTKRLRLSDGGWQRPYTAMEDLQGSTHHLTMTVQSLAASVNTLKSITSDFGRLTRVTQFDRTHEIITEGDVHIAQEAITTKVLPEIHTLLREAELQLSRLAAEQDEWKLQVDQQKERLRQARVPHTKEKKKRPISKFKPKTKADDTLQSLEAQYKSLVEDHERWQNELEQANLLLKEVQEARLEREARRKASRRKLKST